MENLQLILGVDKSNPLFSLYSPIDNSEQLEVYFGLALLERIERGKNSFQLKLLIGRLFNAGYRCRDLSETFNIDLKTIRKWGNALKNNDFAAMEAAFAGHEVKRKLTSAIEFYARSRFRDVYPENRYDYSKLIRNEIIEYFQTELSGETLRAIFKQEKEKLNIPASVSPHYSGERRHADEQSDVSEPLPEAAVSASDDRSAEASAFCRSNECFKEQICDCESESSSENSGNRKYIPSFAMSDDAAPAPFVHHAGLLLILHMILPIVDKLPLRNISCQWLISVMLGAVNIEQSRKLDFKALRRLAGLDFITSPRHQRCALKAGSTALNRLLLLKRNARFADIESSRWFYYDPHGVKYNGMRKILKGWCGGVGKITRVYYQDFIHTQSGKPVFIKYFDNYYDLRERFSFTIPEFRKIFAAEPGPLIFVIDRGIYGHEALTRIHDSGDVIITWEKGYKHDGWNSDSQLTHFGLTRYRNSFQDVVACKFDCIRYPFEKIPGYDRIIVRASAKKKEDIEVSILVNSDEVSTREAVTAMFTRWIQENDFLYEGRHLGINQITSYDYEDYVNLDEELIKKIVESNEYIVLKLRKRSLEKQVKSLLLAQHKQQAGGRKPNEKQQQKLNDLNRELDTLNEEFDTIRKYCTKHEKLIELNAQKLMTTPKQYMDIIRICARNVYFTAFKDFRERFNNFRIDHVIFRTIIQAPGRISTDNRKTTVSLYPAITLQPKEKILVGEYLKRISETVSEKFGSRVDFDLFGTDKSTK
jgi:transposase